MSTTIRPELSEKNPYWIEKHRYYELKHFCLQYQIWKKARAALSSLSQRPIDAVKLTSNIGDPTAKCVEAREFYSERMGLIEKAAAETDAELGDYILKAVTQGISYDHLRARVNVPCCKDVYYELYRRFFWILNRIRK